MQVEDTRVQNIPKWIIKEMCETYKIVFTKITFKQMRHMSYNNDEVYRKTTFNIIEKKQYESYFVLIILKS